MSTTVEQISFALQDLLYYYLIKILRKRKEEPLVSLKECHSHVAFLNFLAWESLEDYIIEVGNEPDLDNIFSNNDLQKLKILL